jgi:PAS domain S-box-containing protein
VTRFLFLLFLLCQYTFATLTITDGKTRYTHFDIAYMVDRTSAMEIDAVSRHADFQTIPSQFTLGYIEEEIWFKVTIKNDSQSSQFVLSLTEPFWDKFTLYDSTPSGWNVQKAGLKTPLSERRIGDAFPVFPLEIEQGTTKSYYINARTVNGCLGSFELYTHEEFFRPGRIDLNVLYLVYASILFLILIINIYLYAVMREKINLYYLGYVATYIVFISMFSSSYLYLGLSGWSHGLHTVGAILLMFMSLFSNTFLDLNKNYPNVARTFKLFTVIFFAFIFLMNTEIPYITLVFNIFAFIFMTSLLVMAIKTSTDKNIQTKFYLYALIVYMPTMGMMALTFDGFLANNEITRYAFLGGALIEIVLFSLILANRYHISKYDEIRLQKRLLEQQRQNEILLEQQVQQRTEALEQLSNYQQNLLSLFDKGDAVLFKWNNDAAWSIDYVSENVEQLLAYSKGEFMDAAVVYTSCMHPDDIEQVMAEVTAAKTEQLDFFKHEPYRVITKTGDVKWVLDYTATQKDSRGNITHFIGYIIDISDQIEAKRAIEKERNQAQQYLDIAGSLLIALDAAGNITLINHEGCEILEAREEEIVGKNWFETFLQTEDVDSVKVYFENLMQGKLELSKFVNNHITTAKGNVKLIAWHNTLIKEDGKIVGILSSGTDITRQKEYEQSIIEAKEAADRANRFKSEFLANMSHEIRTPLNGVIGLTELMLKTELTDKQREYLQKSKSSSQSLLHVINDILDFSKIEAGKLEMEAKSFNLFEVLQTIQNTFEHQAEEKGVSFILDNNADHINVVGDPLRLTQVLTNLSSNAMKFTEAGRIILTARIIDEGEDFYRLQFSVRDSGIGMTQSTIDKLFTSFTQADSSTTRKFGGTGLGLTISKQLTEMMGGKIWVESQEGEGSEFFFTVLFGKGKASEPSPDAEATENEALAVLKDLKLLIAEDNKTNQLVVMGMLEDYIEDLDFADNGEIAVEMTRKKAYDLVLMDIQMPVMDGFEATAAIKAEFPDLPIIALTANAMKEDIEKTKAANMQGHITKPIELHEMLHIIADVMTH